VLRKDPDISRRFGFFPLGCIRIAVNLVLMAHRKNALLESSPKKPNEPDGDRGGRTRNSVPGPAASWIHRPSKSPACDGPVAPSHKLVVELHDIQGYTAQEIAQIRIVDRELQGPASPGAQTASWTAS